MLTIIQSIRSREDTDSRKQEVAANGAAAAPAQVSTCVALVTCSLFRLCASLVIVNAAPLNCVPHGHYAYWGGTLSMFLAVILEGSQSHGLVM